MLVRQRRKRKISIGKRRTQTQLVRRITVKLKPGFQRLWAVFLPIDLRALQDPKCLHAFQHPRIKERNIPASNQQLPLLFPASALSSALFHLLQKNAHRFCIQFTASKQMQSICHIQTLFSPERS